MNINGLENINESLSTHYLIYKITNNINGKYYIGQHKTNNVFDDYMGSGTYLDSSETKYGLSAFSKSILFDFSSFEEMNDKEAELVQLSNCYPYDKMSYNLIPGGNGWHITPEICKQRGAIYSRNYWNKSEEERQTYKNECSKRAQIREKNKTKEQHDIARKNQHETWANKSKQEIQIGVSKWRKASETRTKDQQDEINKKRLATLNARSLEEKLATKKKLKNTIANRSKERKEEIGKKHSDALKNHYKQHPEQAKKHSKLMSGKGNPSYGKKWMINKTISKRIYVKKEEIEYYKKLGYEVGYKL